MIADFDLADGSDADLGYAPRAFQIRQNVRVIDSLDSKMQEALLKATWILKHSNEWLQSPLTVSLRGFWISA